MSVIKIQTKSHIIPIEIGNEKLEFDMSDDNIQKIQNVDIKLAEKLKNIDEEDLNEQKKAIKEMIDSILGEGSFDKLYSVTPSIFIVAEYFLQIAEGLQKEVEKRLGTSSIDKTQKYLKAKKEINKKKSKQNNKK